MATKRCRWMGGLGLTVALAAGSACSSGSGAGPAQAPRSETASEPPQGPPTRQTITLSSPDGLPPASSPSAPHQPPWEPGEVVRARGRKADEPRLQLVATVPGKVAEYMDLEGGGQTLLYLDDFPRCRSRLEVEGTVMEVLGPPQPGGAATGIESAEPRYSELHLDVLRYRCLD